MSNNEISIANTTNQTLESIADLKGLDIDQLQNIILESMIQKGYIPPSVKEHLNKDVRLFILNNGVTRLVAEVLEETNDKFRLIHVMELTILTDLSGETIMSYTHLAEWIQSELGDYDHILEFEKKTFLSIVKATARLKKIYIKTVQKNLKEDLNDTLETEAKASDANAFTLGKDNLKDYNEGIKERVKGLKENQKLLVSPGSLKKN